MFERYTEKARQAVFFARYEASQFGSQFIESEHLLLGLLRKDQELTARLVGPAGKVEAIRKRIETERPAGKSISTSVDLPLSHELKRAMTLGAEESSKMNHAQIDAVHLLLGIMREEKCFAAQLLRDAGLTEERVREEAQRPSEPPPPAHPDFDTPRIGRADNLTLSAQQNGLNPLIGREREMALLEAILSRRTRHCAALIGDSGVGKSAIVSGLAQRIADGISSPALLDRPLLSIDAANLAWQRGRMVERLEEAMSADTILCVEGLFDSSDANHIVSPLLARGAYIIGTGMPDGFRRTIQAAPAFAAFFHAVEVLPSSLEETAAILAAVKTGYEQFHGVTIAEETLAAVLRAAWRFPTRREFPDRAIDLLDEACVRVRVNRAAAVTPADVAATLTARTGAAVRIVKDKLVEPVEGA